MFGSISCGCCVGLTESSVRVPIGGIVEGDVIDIFVDAADEDTGAVSLMGSEEAVGLEDALSLGDNDVNVVANAISDTLLVGENVSGNEVDGTVGCKTLRDNFLAVQRNIKARRKLINQCTHWVCPTTCSCRTNRRSIAIGWID